MGVKGNPTEAELLCYFCNLSLDLQTGAAKPRNHQKGAKEKKRRRAGAAALSEEGRPTSVGAGSSSEGLKG